MVYIYIYICKMLCTLMYPSTIIYCLKHFNGLDIGYVAVMSDLCLEKVRI